MRRFAAGEVDVLVATTVIEVGVDVPNATAMVVMDADRFGVSQLHQLRGRVGRGSAPGLCLLVTECRGRVRRPASGSTRWRPPSTASSSPGSTSRQRREGDVLGAVAVRARGPACGCSRCCGTRRSSREAREDADRAGRRRPGRSAGHPALRAPVEARARPTSAPTTWRRHEPRPVPPRARA